MAVVLNGTTNDITVNGVSVATDAEVSSAVASGVAPKANTADLKEIGVGQTWQDVTASRVVGTTYTNSTGKPILINCFNLSSAIASNATLTINGQVIASQGLTAANGYYFVSGICPNGGTYSLAANGTSQKWLELR